MYYFFRWKLPYSRSFLQWFIEIWDQKVFVFPRHFSRKKNYWRAAHNINFHETSWNNLKRLEICQKKTLWQITIIFRFFFVSDFLSNGWKMSQYYSFQNWIYRKKRWLYFFSCEFYLHHFFNDTMHADTKILKPHFLINAVKFVTILLQIWVIVDILTNGRITQVYKKK